MKEFSPKRSEFFYIKVSDIQLNRDNKLSHLFGDDVQTFYIGAYNKSVDKIHLSKFWKDKISVHRMITEIKFRRVRDKLSDLILEVNSIDRNEFIKSIPDESIDDYIYLKNLKLKKEEVNYQKKETKFLSQYKCISAYKFPDDWFNYLRCPNCNLRPLVWEFNNGRSTACGCGENEYKHFSIEAESIMSYISRNSGSALGFKQDNLMNNWNHWVKTGEIIFKPVNGIW